LRVSVLIALDFPALDLPAKATSRPTSSGHWSKEGALVTNFANWKLIVLLSIVNSHLLLKKLYLLVYNALLSEMKRISSECLNSGG